MSRKDTIIIALLINAGLLALLFMLALNTEDDKVTDQPEISQALTETMTQQPSATSPTPIAMQTPNLPAENDEVDSFLKELTSEDLAQPIVVDEEGYVEIRKEPELVKTAAPTDSKQAADVQYVEVTIKRGDALEKIARNNGSTVDAIKKANNMTSNKLTVGKVLKVPLSKNAGAPAAKASATVADNPPSQQQACNCIRKLF